MYINTQDSHLVESDYFTTAVVTEARGIWTSMIDRENKDVKMTHDGQSSMILF